jgi:tetratricopeptide (TPR) repeat protein
MIGKGSAIIASIFFCSKDYEQETKKNVVKLKKSDGNIVIQDNSGNVNINKLTKTMGTISSVKLDESNNNIIIQEASEGATANVYQIRIDEFPFVAEHKERIKELKELLATTQELHGKDRLAWDQEKTDLEQKVAHLRAKIQEIIKSYETADMDSSPLYKAAFELFIKGKLDDALAVLADAKLKANEKKDTARILKAQMLELQYDFENAEANYLKVVSISPSFCNNLRVTNFYLKLNELKKAELYYTHCAALAKTTEEKACILNNLGILQCVINEHPEAEASYREALQIRGNLAAANPQAFLPDVAATFYNLGTLLRNISEHSKAEASYQEALQIYRDLAVANPKTYLPDVARMLNNLGNLHRDIKKESSKAETSYQKALKIYRELAAANPKTYLPDVAATLYNLGNLQHGRSKYPQARASYWKALQIQRELADINSQAFLPDVAMTLYNLGGIQNDVKEYSKAKPFYQEALQIYRDLAAANLHAYLPDVAKTLNSLGGVQCKIKEYSQAEASYREALQIYRDLADTNFQAFLLDMAMTLANLAHFYLLAVPDKNQSVQYAKEILSYRSSLRHIPSAKRLCIKIAEAVLKYWWELGPIPPSDMAL